METPRYEQNSADKRTRLSRLLGRLAERAGDPYAGDGRWVVETGEGAAIAAGAKDLEDIDVDSAFEGFSDKLAFVLRTRGVEPQDGTVNLRDPRLQQLPQEAAFSTFADEAGEWPGVDAANQTLIDRNQA